MASRTPTQSLKDSNLLPIVTMNDRSPECEQIGDRVRTTPKSSRVPVVKPQQLPSTPNLQPLQIGTSYEGRSNLHQSSRLFIPTLDSPESEERSAVGEVGEGPASLSIPLPVMFQDSATAWEIESPELFAPSRTRRSPRYVLQPRKRQANRCMAGDESFSGLPEGRRSPAAKRRRPTSFVSLDGAGRCHDVSEPELDVPDNGLHTNHSLLGIDKESTQNACTHVYKAGTEGAAGTEEDSDMGSVWHDGERDSSATESEVISFPRVFRPVVKRGTGLSATSETDRIHGATGGFTPSRGSAFSSSGRQRQMSSGISSS